LVQPTESVPRVELSQRLITDLPPAPEAKALATAVLSGVYDVEPGVLEVAPTTDPWR